MAGKKPKGEVNEIINALEHLSTQNGSRADVVQNKRDCFQVGLRKRLGGGKRSAPVLMAWSSPRRPPSPPAALAATTPPPPWLLPCTQKLIRYMTQGIDMSAAFVPATKCVALSKHDLPLKKMLYLYLRTAAKQNAAVALLVVQVGGRTGGQPLLLAAAAAVCSLSGREDAAFSRYM